MRDFAVDLILFLFLPVFLASQASAVVTNVSASRGAAAEALVDREEFPSLTDSFDSGEVLGFGGLDIDDGALVFESDFNEAESDVRIFSGFDLDPQQTNAFAEGYAASNTSIADPGFASTSEGFGVSTFAWDFTVDVATPYLLNGYVDAELIDATVFGSNSSIGGSLVSSIELTNLDTGASMWDHTVSDSTANGTPVTDDFSESGTLAPGSYRLTAESVAATTTFEDAGHINSTSYSFAISVPEPSATLSSLVGVACSLGFASWRSKQRN
jgi:hypothetical protein